jgi:hypothetical protein
MNSLINEKKGVSPLVSTTVLVVFAVSITAIVMMFGSEYFEDIQRKQGSSADLALKCNDMHFSVDENQLSAYSAKIINDGNADIHAFMIRYHAEDGDSIENHQRTNVIQGGVGEIIFAPAPGIGSLESLEIFAKSNTGPKGKSFWSTCGNTETKIVL